MSKIIHYRTKCIACGACAVICPDFFEMSAEDNLSVLKGAKYNLEKTQGELEAETLGCIESASQACPVAIIEIKDDNTN